MPKNDRFGPPKGSENDFQIDPKINQKSVQKTIRTKSRYRTNIKPPKTQKYQTNQQKINKNKKAHKSHVDRFWAAKRLHVGTPKRPKNKQKSNTKK